MNTFEDIRPNMICIDTGRGLSRRLYSAIDKFRGGWVAVEFDAAESRRAGMQALSRLHKECSVDFRQVCYGRDLASRVVECRTTNHPAVCGVADGMNVILVALR